MRARTLAEYGAPFVDETVVENPESEQSAAQGNRAMGDTQALTLASTKARVRFATTADPPAVYDAADVAHKSQWGNGSSTKPTVEKTAAGLYTITYAASFTDELDEAEVLDLWPASIEVFTGDDADDLDVKFLTCSANVVTIAVYSPRGTLADQGDDSNDPIGVVVTLG